MLSQSIIGSVLSNRTTGTPTTQGTFYLNGGTNGYYYSEGTFVDSITGLSYTYPDATTGQTTVFDGTGFETTGSLGNISNFFIDFWFYPKAKSTCLLSETDGFGLGYYYNMIEIDSTGHVQAGIWVDPIASVTSTNQVTLKAWNHIYFYHYNGVLHLQLNGATASELGSVTRSGPGSSYFNVARATPTSMIGGASNYKGYFEDLYISQTSTTSRYDSTKSKYGH